MDQKRTKLNILQELDSQIVNNYDCESNQVLLDISPRILNQIANEFAK